MIHCPSCGSGLRFDIATQKTVCEHCRSSFKPSDLPDSVYDDAETAQVFDSFAYVCPDCGASLMTTDPADAVGFCPYCGGASTIHDKLRKQWKPDKIIPFKITKEQCKEIYVKEVKKNIFVSKKYRDPNLIEGFRGIYMPYVSYRTLVQGNSRLKLKTDEKSVGNYDYTTEYFTTDLNLDYVVDDISVHEASLAFDDHLSEQLEPYDMRGIHDFSPGYLCGFYAETGSDDTFAYAAAAQQQVKDSMYTALKNDPAVKAEITDKGYNFDKAPDDFMPMKLEEDDRRLYPVWFMSYRRKNKITYATVNGQTGRLAADLPLSPLRILIAVFGISAAVFAVLLGLMNFLPTIPATTTMGLSAVFALSGMYIMQHAYIRTVGRAVHDNSIDVKIPPRFYISAAAATLGIIISTTDGTVGQSRSFLGFIIFLGGMIFNLLEQVSQLSLTRKIKNLNLTGLSYQQNGIVAEAKKFKTPNTVLRTIVLFASIASLLTIARDAAAKEIYFVLSGVLAALLFGLALLHIFFQAKVALRRLPQFNKKGAAYDEN